MVIAVTAGQALVETTIAVVEIAERLREAAQTLRRLRGHGLKPQALRTHWPAVVRSSADAYGYYDNVTREPTPSSEQVKRMDEAIGWLLWLEDDERKIVWGRACGIPWRALEDRDGRSSMTLRKYRNEALEEIALHLRGLV